MFQEHWAVFDENNSYLVSNKGRVISLLGSSPHFIKLTSDRDGYLLFKFRINKRLLSRKIHRLVLSAFCRMPKPGEVCDHLNGNKTDNAIENLEWVSIKTNCQRARATGLSILRRGESSNLAKLTQQKVEQMLKEVRRWEEF